MASVSQHPTTGCYNGFQLTSAIRPAPGRPILPREGYRITDYRNPQNGPQIPMLAAAVSRDRLFDVFIELLEHVGDTADVVLESHHERRNENDRPRHFVREYIDIPVLQSYCYEYQEVILDDGCFGLAIVDPKLPCEIQFDDHKLLLVYSRKLGVFEAVMDRFGILRDDSLMLISEGPHLHSTRTALADRFDRFRYCLNAE